MSLPSVLTIITGKTILLLTVRQSGHNGSYAGSQVEHSTDIKSPCVESEQHQGRSQVRDKSKGQTVVSERL